MSLSTRRLFEESAFVALILLFWYLVAWVGSMATGLPSSVRTAGLVMAALFAVVRGVALATEADPVYADPTPESVLAENARALLAAAPWFLAAVVVEVLSHVWNALGLFGLFTSPGSVLVALLGRTGVLVVVLFAVATGAASLRGRHTDRSSSPASSPE